MKKLIVLSLCLGLLVVSAFAADTVTATDVTAVVATGTTLFGVDISTVINVVLAIVALFFGGFLTKSVVKIRTLGNLLIAFADAAEDHKFSTEEISKMKELTDELLGKEMAAKVTEKIENNK